MNLVRFKNKPLLLLITVSIITRVVVYLLLPPDIPVEQYDSVSLLYFSGLTDHFSDYISSTTLIPPASYILTASVFMVLGIKTAIQIRAFVVFAAILDIAAVAILYQTAKSIGIGRRTSLLVMLLFSFVLVPFELWRNGMHYDHHTVFFATAFVASLVLLARKHKSLISMGLVSFAGALLIAQSAVNAAIVPISILLTSLIIYIPLKEYRRLLVSMITCLLLPVISLLLISKKNQSVAQESLTSNKAGPAMMMVVQRAYNYDAEKLRSFAKESGAPDWYLWTYDHATVPTDRLTGKPDTGWLYLSQAFGICFFSTEDPEKTANIFAFDFHPLLQYLRTDTESSRFIKLVEEDSADLVTKPYRLAGYSPELSPRWIGVYGEVSKKLFFKALLKNPVGMFKSFIIQQGIFSIYGPLFPYNIMRTQTNLLVRDGLRTLPGKIPLDPLFALLTLGFAIIGWIAYCIGLITVPVSVVKIFRKKQKQVAESAPNYLLLISIPILLNALVFSCLVGGENDRYFMQITPYIVLLATLLPGMYGTVRHQFQKKL